MEAHIEALLQEGKPMEEETISGRMERATVEIGSWVRNMEVESGFEKTGMFIMEDGCTERQKEKEPSSARMGKHTMENGKTVLSMETALRCFQTGTPTLEGTKLGSFMGMELTSGQTERSI